VRIEKRVRLFAKVVHGVGRHDADYAPPT
jgi:hypothetical protein